MNESYALDVGSRVRNLREQRGLSLRALAELCDLSPNTISLIERGVSSPTVSTLHELANGLGVPITAFFAESEKCSKVILTRPADRSRAGSAAVVLESLAAGLCDQGCDPFVAVLKPGASSGRKVMTHAGHELVFCLDGRLDYEVDGKNYPLGPGDSLLFHADLPHRWRNANSKQARFLLLMIASEGREHSVDQHLHP